ncbi:MAG: hypothetical protein ACYCP0_06040 [Acidiferrobacteraceae bacterium]
MPKNLVLIIAGLLTPLLAAAGPPVPLTLRGAAADSAALSAPATETSSLGNELKPDEWVAPGKPKFFHPSVPGIPEARFLLKSNPLYCPTTLQWCERQTIASYALAPSVGAGVGLKVGRLHFEYAQGLANHFNFLGVGTRFSP